MRDRGAVGARVEGGRVCVCCVGWGWMGMDGDGDGDEEGVDACARLVGMDSVSTMLWLFLPRRLKKESGIG